MPIPVSAVFDLCDWNSRADDVAVPYGAVINDNTSGFLSSATALGTAVYSGESLLLAALGEQSAAKTQLVDISLPLAVSDTFSFEVDVEVTNDLPDGWSDPRHRVFIGVCGAGKYCAGFYITKKQLMLAASVADEHPVPLHGSSAFMYDTAGNPARFTLRALVEAATGRVSIYLGKTADVYDREYASYWVTAPFIDQRYNLPAKATPAGVTPGFYSVVIGPSSADMSSAGSVQAGKSSIILLSAVRVSSTLATPPVRPVAVLSAPPTCVVGRALRLDASQSYDPSAMPITYRWGISYAPRGSKARLQGSAQATAVTGTTAADIVVTHLLPTEAANDYTLVFIVSGLNTPLSYAFSEATGYLTVYVATDGAGAPITTVADLIEAFSDKHSIAFNSEVAAKFSVAPYIVGSSGSDVLNTLGGASFTGGAVSSLPQPVFIPDVAGAYVISLQVDNGDIRSQKVLTTLVCSASEDALGYRPNTEHILKCLPDFWSMVKSREMLPSIWSAISQAVSDEMARAWQHDYGKSIRDISRQYKRRWLRHQLFSELPDAYTLESPAGGEATFSLAPAFSSSTYLLKKAPVVGVYKTAPLPTGKALYKRGHGTPTIVTVGGHTYAAPVWSVVLSQGDISLFDPQQSTTTTTTTNGRFIGNSAASTPPATNWFNFGGLSMADVNVGDAVKFTRLGKSYIAEVTALNPAGEENTVALSLAGIAPGGAFPPSSSNISFTWLRASVGHTLTVQPYIKYESLAEYGILYGDLLRVIVLDPYTATEASLYLPILAVDTQAVFPDWSVLVGYLSSLAVTYAPTDVWTLSSSISTVTRVSGFVRTSTLAKQEDLVSVPALGTTTVSADYVENRDFTVEDGSVQFVPAAEATLSLTINSGSFVLPAASINSPDLNKFQSLEEVLEVAPVCWVKTGVDAGFYPLTSKGVDTLSFEANFTATVSNEETVCLPFFSHLNVPAESLWAELSYFDNYKMIEGNFGTFVGLPKQDILDAGVDVDYLSAVRSLVFGFMSNPSSYNLGLVVDAFCGLPYTEHACQVIQIEEPTEENPGYVVVRNQFGRNIVYDYPYGAQLANNPSTGRTIGSFPLLDASDVLTAEEKDSKADATLPAYSRLFSNSVVADYVGSPEKIDLALQAVASDPLNNVAYYGKYASRYHTFVVEVPLNLTGTTAMFELLATYLRELKPAYTNFILIGVYSLQEQLPIEDDMTLVATLRLGDTPHTPVFSSKAQTDLLYPSNGVSTKAWADGVPSTAADVVERYESLHKEGIIDDYSGDGSNNSAHAQLDQINAVDNTDVDVTACQLWVPITKDTSTPDFIPGEELGVIIDGVIFPDGLTYCWASSPPVLQHVGSPPHPTLPGGVYSPQYLHPDTYVVLGFNRPQNTASLIDPAQAVDNYGSEVRLNSLWHAAAAALATVKLLGLSSGAEADVVYAPDLTSAGDSKYFYLEYVQQTDKLVENNPISQSAQMITTYFPVGGKTVGTFAADMPDYLLGTSKLAKQVQQYPYDPTFDLDQQFVPSFGPGFYAEWAGAAAGDPVTYGFTDVGPVLGAGVPIAAFTKDPTALAIENVHIGYKQVNRKWRHYTHGLASFVIPPPEIVELRAPYVPANHDVRIEGYYFVAPDVLMKNGCWVYAKNAGSGVETPAAVVDFETLATVAPGYTVLGIPAAQVLADTLTGRQVSTGHVLNVKFPAVAAGQYYMVVRNYREYVPIPLAAPITQVDEVISATTYAL